MINLHSTLQKLGINKSDTLMIHGNAGIAAQFTTIDNNKRLEYFFNQLVGYIEDEGTIVIPAFSYSFTKGEDFNVEDTESCVGQFSEFFRKQYDWDEISNQSKTMILEFHNHIHNKFQI